MTSRAFQDALSDPERVQRALLKDLLEQNATSAYVTAQKGEDDFRYEAFRERFPLIDADGLEPWVARAIAGEENVLFSQPVVYFAASSGTTGRRKYVPLHAGCADNYALHFDVWDTYFHAHHPELAGPSLHFLPRIEGTLPGGALYGSGLAWYYDTLLAAGRWPEIVPAEVFATDSVVARNYCALAIALRQTDLRGIKGTNPSTVLLLAQDLDRFGERLLFDLRHGGASLDRLPPELAALDLPAAPEIADQIEQRRGDAETLLPRHAWKDLGFIACWTGAGAGLYQSDLLRVFGDVVLWEYAYASTEGCIGAPVRPDGACVPLLTSNFQELLVDGETKPLVTAEVGEIGELILTEPRGLYRYRMEDLIEVVGRLERTPLFRFRQKTSAVGSLTGEKLTEYQVVRAFDRVRAEVGIDVSFFCLAAVWGAPPGYALLLEPAGAVSDEVLIRLVERFEAALIEANAEYERKRTTRRLAPPFVRRLAPGTYDAYLDRLEAETGRDRNRIKTPRVSMKLDLAAALPGRDLR